MKIGSIILLFDNIAIVIAVLIMSVIMDFGRTMVGLNDFEQYYFEFCLTLNPPLTTIVPYANNFDLDMMPSNFASIWSGWDAK